MAVNLDKPQRWRSDIDRSVDMYNKWFLRFAPRTFRKTRSQVMEDVVEALKSTNNLLELEVTTLLDKPNILAFLRMSTCPPLAVDRLAGIAGVSSQLLRQMEKKNAFPPRMSSEDTGIALQNIVDKLGRLLDHDIFVWLTTNEIPTEETVNRAATIVADRLCGSLSNPIIRNAQEDRQLRALGTWLRERGYRAFSKDWQGDVSDMPPGTFTHHKNIVADSAKGISKRVNIPIDIVVMRKTAKRGDWPLLIEAKSAGDFANTNKRRKEEALKFRQLKDTYGTMHKVEFILFLGGYFDAAYLGHEAADGIDWVWEHRIDDLEEFGL